MNYENLFFEDGKGRIIPFVAVRHINTKRIYVTSGTNTYIDLDEVIPSEQIEAYKRWVNLSTPIRVQK